MTRRRKPTIAKSGHYPRETITSAGLVLDTLRDVDAETAERKRRVEAYAASVDKDGRFDWSVVTGERA